MSSILIIQTAFIGDVILATALIETLKERVPGAEVDFLLREGNQGLLSGHPGLRRVLVWDKKGRKFGNLAGLLKHVRKEKYDHVVNCQRFASTGLLTAFSGAGARRGFRKNPLSFLFDRSSEHVCAEGVHEIDRNHTLVGDLAGDRPLRPKLYPSEGDYEAAAPYLSERYVCIAPSSVWHTKQFPAGKWVEFIDTACDGETAVNLIGAANDSENCRNIVEQSVRRNIRNLAGKLSLLQTAALMKTAAMNYTNDSAPLHLASAMNAPVTAVYCSTVPAFGFGPLSDDSRIVETKKTLSCRPCGLHGRKSCPEGHFECALGIDVREMRAP